MDRPPFASGLSEIASRPERLHERVHPFAGAELPDADEPGALETRADFVERVRAALRRPDEHVHREERACARARPVGLHDVIAKHEAASR